MAGHEWKRGPGAVRCAECGWTVEVDDDFSDFQVSLSVALAGSDLAELATYAELHEAGVRPTESCEAYREHVAAGVFLS